jgi:hypothetical protein
MLQMVRGYKLESSDCMVCDYVGGPLIIRKAPVAAVALQIFESVSTIDISFRED